MVYYIIACTKEGMEEEEAQKVINQYVVKDRSITIGQCFPLGNDKVKKTEFKIGSLDQLMELMDTFQKYETLLDGSCKRNEKLFFELREELKADQIELNIELGPQQGNVSQTVEQYLQDFRWNNLKFKMQDKSLQVLGANIYNVQKSYDDQLKKRLDAQQTIKQKLNALTKKQGNNLTQKDLADCVYEKIQEIGKDKFVQSHDKDGMNYSELLTSILVVVNKKKEVAFKQNYLTYLSDHNRNDFENWKKRQENLLKQQHSNIEDPVSQMELVAEELDNMIRDYKLKMDNPGVVPFSDENLKINDADGNTLYSIVCMQDQANDYIKVLKKNGFPAQKFDCDPQGYLKELELKSQLEMNLNTMNMKLLKECKAFFGELFQALVHLKIMRVFIDGVLRYGIPPKFFLCFMKPDKNKDKKIMDALSTHFAEEHLKDMYGEKQDAQDEDFFPYISSALTSPAFLNQ